MLKINEHEATIGPSYNNRSELAGEEPGPIAIDLGFKDYMIGLNELDQLIPSRGPKFSTQHFDDKGLPYFMKARSVAVAGKIQTANVTIAHGSERKTFHGVTVKDVKAVLCADSGVKISGTLQLHPSPTERDKDWIDSFLRLPVMLAIDCEQYGAQTDLEDEPEDKQGALV